MTNEIRTLDISDVNVERKPFSMLQPHFVGLFLVFRTSSAVEADLPIVRTYKHLRYI